MRKRVPFLLLLASILSAGPSSADPLRVTSGAFLVDIEADMFTFSGPGFTLATRFVSDLYSAKLFPGRCDPAGSAFGFCAEVEGALVNWSFHTTGGEQLLGRGAVTLGSVNATNVDFVGSMRFDVVPTPLDPGGTLDFDFVAPFSFEAMIRGIEDGEELFARQFIGSGRVSVNYEGTLRPGIFAAADDTIEYRFDAAAVPVPEPGTFLLLGSGLVAVLRGRRRRPIQ